MARGEQNSYLFSKIIQATIISILCAYYGFLLDQTHKKPYKLVSLQNCISHYIIFHQECFLVRSYQFCYNEKLLRVIWSLSYHTMLAYSSQISSYTYISLGRVMTTGCDSITFITRICSGMRHYTFGDTLHRRKLVSLAKWRIKTSNSTE